MAFAHAARRSVSEDGLPNGQRRDSGRRRVSPVRLKRGAEAVPQVFSLQMSHAIEDIYSPGAPRPPEADKFVTEAVTVHTGLVGSEEAGSSLGEQVATALGQQPADGLLLFASPTNDSSAPLRGIDRSRNVNRMLYRLPARLILHPQLEHEVLQ
jgi:hypothetical protein